MTQETKAVFDHAKNLYAKTKYGEAADYIYDNLGGEHGYPSITFFEGECFERLGELHMAKDCYKNAYLSTLGWV